MQHAEKTIEFMIRETTRYLVTRYTKSSGLGGVETVCESMSYEIAESVASSMAKSEGALFVPMVGGTNYAEKRILENEIPDVASYANSIAFMTWVEDQPKAMRALHSSNRAEDAIAVIRAYKAATGE